MGALRLNWQQVPYLAELVDYARGSFLRPAPAIPTFYLVQAELALHSLSVLMQHSLAEDQYGVVQKDLSALFAAFLQLELNIDLYIRSTSVSMVVVLQV